MKTSAIIAHRPIAGPCNRTSCCRAVDSTSIYRLFVLVAAAVLGLAALIVSQSVFANHNGAGDWSQSEWEDGHIVVFSDCNYSGKSKLIPRGDFKRMKRVGVDQNAVSSIMIPEGLAVEVFQKTNFEGHWYRLNQSQSCLKGKWNDRIGSMRVLDDDVNNSYGFSQQDARGNGCFPFQVTAARGDGAFRLVDSERRLNEVASRRAVDGEICDQQTVRIELAKRDPGSDVVFSIAGDDFRFAPNDVYDDFRRDWYRQYYTIQLPEVRYEDDQEYGQGKWGDTEGFGPRYSSGLRSGENWGNNYRGRWYAKAGSNYDQGSGQGNNSGNDGNNGHANQNPGCTPYRIIGNHSDTGVRFLTGDQSFHRLNNGAVNGELCQVGSVRVELAKKQPSATVVLQINGQSYSFRANDTGDRFNNGWYRKYINIDVR